MRRIRQLATTLGLSLLATACFAPEAPAALLHPNDTSTFPDLSAGYVSGTLNYTASTGQLAIQNTPYALALGPGTAAQYDVNAAADGRRAQTLQAQVNPDGTINASGNNLYQLYGSVTVNGQTFNGLLLQGTPTAMGSLNLADAPTGVKGASMFDFDVKITGGLLQQAFGSEAYIRAMAERQSTFQGSFAQDFSGVKVATNIRGYDGSPAPVPEPSTLVVLLACGGAGLLFRRRRRIGLDELERPSA